MTSYLVHFNPLYRHTGEFSIKKKWHQTQSKLDWAVTLEKLNFFFLAKLQVKSQCWSIWVKHFYQLLQYFSVYSDWNASSQTSRVCSAVQKRSCNYSAWLWRLELSTAAVKLNKNHRTVEDAAGIFPHAHVLAIRIIIIVGLPDGTTIKAFRWHTWDNNNTNNNKMTLMILRRAQRCCFFLVAMAKKNREGKQSVLSVGSTHALTAGLLQMTHAQLTLAGNRLWMSTLRWDKPCRVYLRDVLPSSVGPRRAGNIDGSKHSTDAWNEAPPPCASWLDGRST